MDPQVGQLINNKYRLLRLIGDGGMGSVWEARHELLGTSVALKFLHATLARRKGLVERFLQEARVSARIKSPNVVHVSDVDRTPEGLAYMVMEYIDGETLQTLYERNYQQGQRMSYGEAFTNFLQMLDGVAAAHRLGIVHRDLKPDNVMLTTDSKGRPLVKLLDFGIAKLKASGEVDRGLTRPGVVMGTPEYMAPEQAFSADRVDGRADIFSLGVMFFEMLAGRRPVGGDNAHAIAAQYLEGSIAQLRELARNIDPQLAEAVHKAMAAKPEDRYQAVEQFREAVEPFAPEGPRSRKRSSNVPKTPAAEFDASSPKGLEAALEDTSPTSDPEDVDTRAMDSKALEDERTADVPSGDTQNDASDTQNDAVRAGTEAMPAVPEIAETGTARMHAVQDKRPASGTVVGEPFETPAPYGATPVNGPGAYAQPTPAITPMPGRRPSRSGPSLLSILLIASIVSGAVVGGLYLAHRHSLQEEADNPPPKPVPTQVAPEPQVVTEPAQPDPTPPVVEPQPPPPTVQPPSKPNPNPKPQPSGQPKPEPSGPPPIIPTVLPSEFPPIPPIFPLPGQIQPQPPGTQPQPQPPAQPPPSKPPRVIFRPRSAPKAAPTQQTPEASTEKPPVIFKHRPRVDVQTSTPPRTFRRFQP